MNATAHVVESFSKPCAREMTAPPTMAVDKIPEAWVVYRPRPLTDKEKIVANMIELKNPTAIIVHTAL